MFTLRNDTPFEPMIAVFPDVDGVDTLHALLHATFSLRGSTLEIAERQRKVQLVDEYIGEPARSSLRRAGELHTGKRATDVVMLGDAWAEGHSVSEMDVALVVGPVRKTVRVFGDREWRGLSGHTISSAVPFARMPLVYERAFGGILEIDQDGHPVRMDPRNPLGVGPARLQGSDQATLRRLPNLEDPLHLLQSPRDEPPPACFGFVAPSWLPRSGFSGTYDETWQATRAPFLPADFDPRFLQVAPPGLVCPAFLQGGEPIYMLGASPHGPLHTHVPHCDVEVAVKVARKVESIPMRLQTLLIEPNEQRLGLSFHGALRCDKRILQVEEIRFGLRSIDIDTRAA